MLAILWKDDESIIYRRGYCAFKPKYNIPSLGSLDDSTVAFRFVVG